MNTSQLLPGQELYNFVRAGFLIQNTSLSEWCRNNGFPSTNAKACLHGTWGGPKGTELRERLVKESRIESLSLKSVA